MPLTACSLVYSHSQRIYYSLALFRRVCWRRSCAARLWNARPSSNRFTQTHSSSMKKGLRRPVQLCREHGRLRVDSARQVWWCGSFVRSARSRIRYATEHVLCGAQQVRAERESSGKAKVQLGSRSQRHFEKSVLGLSIVAG